MSDEVNGDLLTVVAEWNLRYEYFGGEAATKFYNEVRENGRLFGARCSECKRVLVPPRGYCEDCYRLIDDWVEVGPEGVVQTFTILTLKLDGFPPPPVLIAYVQLDGADTSIANYVTGVDMTDVESVGREFALNPPRVKAVFNDERTGRVSDFHFELV